MKIPHMSLTGPPFSATVNTYIIGTDKDSLCTLNCIDFLTHQFKHVFWCSKELSHLDGSFEYPQHKFWLRNKKNNVPARILIWRPVVHDEKIDLKHKQFATLDC